MLPPEVLSEVAAFVWGRLDGQRDLANILADIVQTFEVDADRARADLEAFAAVVWKRADCAITERLVGSFLSDSQFSGRLVPCFQAGAETSVVFLLRAGDEGLRDRMDAWLALPGTGSMIEAMVKG